MTQSDQNASACCEFPVLRPNRVSGWLMALLAAWISGCASPAEDVADYPSRPIKLIVPFSPGGGTDTFARIVKKAIDDQHLLGQPLVIVNVDGAGGTIGSRRVKNARPDGYTIMVLHEAIVSARYAGQAPYGPEAFEPIAGTGKMGLVVAVRDDSPFASLGELLAAAREAPDSIVFSANLGAPVHFLGLMLEQHSPGARFRFTQTGGGTKRLHAVKGGHADVTAFSIEEFVRYRDAGIRALAYCDDQRHPVLPDVPTMFEQGLPVQSVNMQFWWAPKGTPQSKRDVLAEALRAAMQTEHVRARMAAIHCDPVVVTGPEMAAEIQNRRDAISRVDLRQTQALPNLPALILPVLGVLGLAVGWQSWHAARRVGGSETGSRNPVHGGGTSTPATVPVPVSLGLLREADVDHPDAARRSTGTLDPPWRLALCCVLATAIYVVCLSWLDFRPLTFAYVVVVAGTLVRWNARRLPAVLVLAVALGLGTHYVLTRVFDLVLP